MKIVIDDKIPYIAPGLEALRTALASRPAKPLRCDIDYGCLDVVALPGAAIDRTAVADADVLIVRTRTRCDRSLLEGSRVGLVVTATIGFDHIDTQWLESAGIAWTNCPGCNATSVAQYVGSCLLLLGRQKGLVPEQLTVGVVGVGHVGSAVVERLREMGIGRIMLCDPPREEHGERPAPLQPSAPAIEPCTCRYAWSSLGEVMSGCDVVTLHTPLTREGRHATWHLLDSAMLGAMKPGGVVINAARGGVVDEEALEAALDAGIVGEAIIDTWEGEPRVRRSLLARAFIATPHIAGYSADGKANATRMALKAVARHIGMDMDFDVRPPRLEQQPPHATGEELALWLYDPRRDSELLKQNPGEFEKQRGNYPLRREKLD